MSRKALILGASGRIGRHVSAALAARGWQVHAFRRGGPPLEQAATGASLIVNGWNPPYSEWAATVPRLTGQVIAAARASGAAVMIPGNVYVHGRKMPRVLTPETPHAADNPLGRIRVELEAAYRDAGVRTVVLRAGDFIDTEASGNWFDRIIAVRAAQGRLRYPGPLDRAHAWAWLPDLAAAFAGLAARLEDLPAFTEVGFPGYTLTGAELGRACGEALGRDMAISRMSWLPLRLARPFWPEARHLLELRYLWERPHAIDGSALDALLPDRPRTPPGEALARALASLAG